MAIPLIQQARVGAYVLKHRIKGTKRYPLVLMLEPLFRCNLACAGCGKIDYPDDILNQRLSVADCLAAVDECGAPVVAIPGGEPLLHKEMDQIVAGIVARKKFVIMCTNALLLEKKLHLFTPSPYLTFSIHLDGLKEEHDKSVCQHGVFDRAVSAVKKAREMGFRVILNCTLFDNANPERVAQFMDFAMNDMKVEHVTMSPGYAYERAPDQQHFLSRKKTKILFREILRRGKGKKWRFSQSTNFLDFLAGNREYHCTPWGMPTRNVFGWQRPCYLLGEGYANSFRELMDETEWDKYGTGNYEKCSNCMVHCGYEPSSVTDTLKHPLKALKTSLFGIRTEGEMAPEIDLSKARPAEWVHDRNVAKFLTDLHVKRQAAKSRESTAA